VDDHMKDRRKSGSPESVSTSSQQDAAEVKSWTAELGLPYVSSVK
jgi:hypothetical protein